MSLVIFMPRAHPNGYDNHVPAARIVRWHWISCDSCCEVLLDNNTRILTRLRDDEIAAKYNAAMEGK
jgi:hypothetical protein